MTIRSKAEDLLNRACVTDGPDGVDWVVADAPVEALREALKEESPAEVVADINTEVYSALFGDREPSSEEHDLLALATLTYRTDGNYEGIEFLGQNLWDDQDNGIPWDDAKDEPVHWLKDHLRLKMAQTIRALSTVANACEKGVGK